MTILDCHRLGKPKASGESPAGTDEQSTSDTRKNSRPIIFKVKDYFTVRTIRENLPKLKTYFENNPQEPKVAFRPHIPRQMYLQRKTLQSKFTELYTANLNPKWQLDVKTAKYYIKDKNEQKYYWIQYIPVLFFYYF